MNVMNPTNNIYSEVVFIILSKQQLERRRYITVFDTYSFSSVRKCHWKCKNDDKGNIAPVWYSLGDDCLILKLESLGIDKCLPLHTIITFDDIDDFISRRSPFLLDLAELGSSNHKIREILLPKSLLHRELLATTEFNLCIKIHKFYSEGWIEVDPPSLGLFIYMAHYRWTDMDAVAFNRESVVVLRSILPIYLWGKLVGEIKVET